MELQSEELFTLEKFSTDLLVESFCYQLELSFPVRHYNGIGYTDCVKSWTRFSETLVNCLKTDLKIGKQDRTKSGEPFYREHAASVICKWYPDVILLEQMYRETLRPSIQDDHVQKETDTIHIFISNLLNIGKYIFARHTVEEKKTEDEDAQKSELVLIFDDTSSK